MINPRTADYLAKVRAHILEGEENIARQQAAAATLDRGSTEADLTQRLVRLLEHVRAMQIAELDRVSRRN